MGNKRKEIKETSGSKDAQLKSFARYSTIGVQMIAIIVGGYYLGVYIDESLSYTTPFYQKWVGLAAVFLAMASVLLQVINLQK